MNDLGKSTVHAQLFESFILVISLILINVITYGWSRRGWRSLSVSTICWGSWGRPSDINFSDDLRWVQFFVSWFPNVEGGQALTEPKCHGLITMSLKKTKEKSERMFVQSRVRVSISEFTGKFSSLLLRLNCRYGLQ